MVSETILRNFITNSLSLSPSSSAAHSVIMVSWKCLTLIPRFSVTCDILSACGQSLGTRVAALSTSTFFDSALSLFPSQIFAGCVSSVSRVSLSQL